MNFDNNKKYDLPIVKWYGTGKKRAIQTQIPHEKYVVTNLNMALHPTYVRILKGGKEVRVWGSWINFTQKKNKETYEEYKKNQVQLSDKP